MNNARRLSPNNLATALAEARRATLAASLDLSAEQWRVPFDPGIQPVAWDLAHIGWFAEFWLLRGPHRLSRDGFMSAHQAHSRFAPDEHYDSSKVDHPDRWRIKLYERDDLLARLAEQLAACQDAVSSSDAGSDIIYFGHLALLHELMHVEALAWTRSLLAYPPPKDMVMPRIEAAKQIAIDAGQHAIGTDPTTDFAFDNEHPPKAVTCVEFTIDSQVVRNDQFAAFVCDGGYSRREFWPGIAGRWLEQSGRTMPIRWRSGPIRWRSGPAQQDSGKNSTFEHRHYDQWLPLPADEPTVHITAYEAEAFCRWAGRRLPTAAEWEIAADRMQWGSTVWEWTADAFAPYPNFRPGPYVTYSAPWFHHQREMRGGAYTTHALMHDRRYRNFFLAHRTDVFAGFRTARSV